MSAAARATPALFPSGEVLGRFKVEGVLGIGGTGTVFRARDAERDTAVALKAIPHDAVLGQRARREAAVAGRLDHPHVVRLLEVVDDDDYVYVVSELVDGGDLAGALRAGTLSDADRVRAVSAVCDALAHAHSRGVVHRDVKPANVLVGRDGSVRLADFGIAALADPDATVDDRLLGTLSYMAPESCRGVAPAASADVWAAGVLVYESLTGANPFRARTPEELCERHGARVRPLEQVRPDLPRSLTRACARALSVNPRRRPSAAALRTSLASAADELDRGRPAPPRLRPVAAAPSSPRPSLPRPSLSRPDLAGAARSALAVQVPLPVVRRGARLARRFGPALAAGVATGAVLTAFPFWPTAWVPVLAVACGALALVAPWPAAAAVLALSLPALGNLSAGLAWAVGAIGLAWLLACAGAGRRALLPVLAVPLVALPLWPAYIAVSGCLRSAPGRFAAGAAGPLVAAAWTSGPDAAAALRGSGDVQRAARALLEPVAGGLGVQAVCWGVAAALFPLLFRLDRRHRPVAVAGWLSLLCVGQALLPALAGAPPEGVWASVGAVWIAGIVLLLGVDLRPHGGEER